MTRSVEDVKVIKSDERITGCLLGLWWNMLQRWRSGDGVMVEQQPETRRPWTTSSAAKNVA